MRFQRLARYTGGARPYDVLVRERTVYRAGLVVGIEELRRRPGDRVLDAGRGMSPNFVLLIDAVGA